MRNLITSVFFTSFLVFYLAIERAQCQEQTTFTYPTVKSVPETFSYPAADGNITFTDNYYWMESANETDADLEKFFTDQDDLIESYLKQCNDRSSIKQAILQATQFDAIGNVQLFGEKSSNPTYSYSLQRYGESNPTWYLANPEEFEQGKKSNFNPAPGKPFLNESLLSADQSAYIYAITISPDGKFFGYLVSESSEDSGNWYWRSIDSPLISAQTTPHGGEGRLSFTIPFGDHYSTLYWLEDSSGFFYTTVADSNGGTNQDLGMKVLFHRWADADVSTDVVVFEAHNLGGNTNSTALYFLLSKDNRWFIVSGYADTSGKVRTYATLLTDQTISSVMKWISLAPETEFQMWPITVIGDDYYFQTDKDAENSKVAKVKLDFSNAKTVKLYSELTDRPEIVDVIPERKDALLSVGGYSWPIADHFAILRYIEQGQQTLYFYDLLAGEKIEQILPDEKINFRVIAYDLGSKKDFLQYSSFDTPTKIYEFEVVDGKLESSLVTAQSVAGSNADEFEAELLFATSKDGTQIPYFITSRKGTPKDGTRPAWLHAFAAYGETDNLYYLPSYFTWLANYGGFFVWCGARGGGDEGGEWHKAAQGVNKQSTFDDILACAEDMVERKITSKGQIIVEGGGAGALAMAVVVNQAPEGLIGAASLLSGPYDAFLFELRTSIGANNMGEFGNVTDPNEIDSVYKWSPYQNIDPKKQYPAILALASTEDSVIPPAASYKYIAQLQFTHPQSSTPILMYLKGDEGHKAQTGTLGRVEQSIYELCVTSLALGLQMQGNH